MSFSQLTFLSIQFLDAFIVPLPQLTSLKVICFGTIELVLVAGQNSRMYCSSMNQSSEVTSGEDPHLRASGLGVSGHQVPGVNMRQSSGVTSAEEPRL